MVGCPEGIEGGHETFCFHFTSVMWGCFLFLGFFFVFWFFFHYLFIMNLVTLEKPATALGTFVKLFLLVCSLRFVHDCGWTLIALFT